MSRNSALDAYRSIYKEMNFERLELFRFVAETYPCKEVLYPGSSIHVTPSFVFPHVVYVDKSAEAKSFFDNQKEVLDFVSLNREYKRKPFLKFIHQDYSQPLPLRKGSFDLLLSFFAGTVAPICGQYLREGGLLVTNQRKEADETFELVMAIRFQGGKYRLISEADIPAEEAVKKYLRQSHRGLEYSEKEIYFIFEKYV